MAKKKESENLASEGLAKDHWMSEFERQKAEESEKLKLRDSRRAEQKKREQEKIKKLRKLEQEMSKVNKRLVNRPYKLLWALSTMFTLLFVLFIIFIELDLFKSVFFTFWVFTSLFFGGGLIMAGIFYLVSVDKEQELREQLKIDILRAEEEARLQAEHDEKELQRIEQEVSVEHFTELPRAKALAAKNMEGGTQLPTANQLPAGQGLDGNQPLRSIGNEPQSELPDSITADDSTYQLTELDMPSAKMSDLDLQFDMPFENPEDFKMPQDEIDFDAIPKKNTPVMPKSFVNEQDEPIRRGKEQDSDYIERVFG